MKKSELRQIVKEELLKEKFPNDPYDISEQLDNLLDNSIENIKELSKLSDSKTKNYLSRMVNQINSVRRVLLELREQNNWI